MSERQHPTLEEIALWLIEPDSAELEARVRAHLDGTCPLCSEAEAALRRLARDVDEALRTQASVEVRARARAIASRGAASGSIRTAALLHDTVELAGVRGETAGARYLLYQAGEYDLSVRIRPEARRGRSELRIQLHGPAGESPRGIQVRVLNDDRVLGESVTDELGEVHIPHFSNPPYFLELVRGPLTIRTPPIQ